MLQIKNLDSDTPILEIYEPIGIMFRENGEMIGVSGGELSSALNYINAIGNKKRIQLYINSDGGSVSDGMTMYAAIQSSVIPVDTVCVGICVSMAGVVLQAGKKRLMTSWGQVMIHPPAGGDVKDLVALKETLIKMLCKTSGIDEKEMEELMDSTSWLNAQQCLEYKLIDEIIDITPSESIPNITDSTTTATAYKAMQPIANSLNKKKSNSVNLNTMEKTIAHLNLPSASTDIDVLNVIKERENGLKNIMKSVYNARKNAKKKDEADPDPDEKPEDAMAKLVNQVKDLVASNLSLQNLLNAKTEECDNLKRKDSEMEDAKKTEEAEAFVTQAVNSGYIKDDKDAKANLLGLYIVDKDMATNLLNGMNTGKKNTPFKVTPPARNAVIKEVEKVNGLRQVTATDTEDNVNPFKKFSKDAIDKAKEATKNYKEKAAK